MTNSELVTLIYGGIVTAVSLFVGICLYGHYVTGIPTFGI